MQNINKYVIYILALFFLINGAIYYITNKNAEQRVHIALKQNMHNLQTHYNLLLESQKITANTTYQSTISSKRLIDIIEQANHSSIEEKKILRQELIELLTLKYDRAKQKGVLQFQFVFPDNKSFLRMHKPSRYGDDLTDIRDDFKIVNETLKPIRGFVQGRVAHGFRNTFPIFSSSGKHIGAMEVSFSSDSFQWYLNNISHIHSHFLVNKDVFTAKAWKRDDLILKYAKSEEHTEYMVTMNKNTCVMHKNFSFDPLQKSLNDNIHSNQAFSHYILSDTEALVISFLPIQNLYTQNAAWLVSYEKSPFILSTFKNMRNIRIIGFIFSLLLLYLIIKLLVGRERLQKLNSRTQLALYGSNTSVVDWDYADNNIYFSSSWKEMLGYLDEELPNQIRTWKERIHPDDKASIFSALQKAKQEKSKNFEHTHRLLHKEGHWIWILGKAQIIYDEDNNPIRMVGTHTNITQERIQTLKTNQQTQIIEQIHDSVISTDLEGIIISWNSGSTQILGYSEVEMLGSHISKIYLPEDLKSLATNIETLNETGEVHTVVRLIKKSKEIIDANLSLSSLKDNNQEVIGMVGYVQDITKRKRAEDALKEQHTYLQSIIDGVEDPIMVIKEDYSIELMNDTLHKNMEFTQVADPLHPKCYEISHHRSTPCDGIEHPCPLRDVLASKEHTIVLHNHKNIDGEKHYVELSATPLFDKERNCIGIIESARDITSHLKTQNALREQKNILDYQAHHDSLTGLPNRISFSKKLTQSIESSTELALLFIDLDHFKEINDSLGHEIGDEVLKIVTSRLRQVLPRNATLSRLGGDEFTVILESKTQKEVTNIATQILDTLAQSINLDHNLLYVSSSIGISLYPNDGHVSTDLLKYADAAMYKAKEEGRNNYQFYSSEMTELAFERVVMEASLRQALENSEFTVFYQAQVDAQSELICGMEALVRWEHPSMGIISPAKFIPLAESTGLIIELDRFVMKTAMTQLVQWYKEGLNPGKLAMNLAIKQLQEKDFLDVLITLLEETHCQAEWIALEVTEGQIMLHPEEAIEILNQVSALGIELAIDDFGTGYSSLSYLKKLPINKLKIDQSFIQDLPDDEEDVAIAKAIIALAQSLNLRIIAEGVETKEQKEFLLNNGCPNIQGYYYSKPVTEDAFKTLLIDGLKQTD